MIVNGRKVDDMTKKTMKSTVKDILNELLDEKDVEAKKDDKKRILVEYSSEDVTHQPTTKGPYMVLYINSCPAPFRLRVNGWMGGHSSMFNGNSITCLEQTDNLEQFTREDGIGRIKILVKDLKSPPTLEKMREIKAKHVASLKKKPQPKKDSKAKSKTKPKSSAKGKKSKAKKK